MPLYAVLAREYFGPRIMGTVFGAARWCPVWAWPWTWAGGMIFDTFQRLSLALYRLLSVGLGAMAVAAGLPATSRRSRERLQPA